MNIKKAIKYNRLRKYENKVIARIQATVGARETRSWDSQTVEKIGEWQARKNLKYIDGMVGSSTFKKLSKGWGCSPTSSKRDVTAFSKAKEANAKVGPFMCQVLFQTIDPSTTSGVKHVRRIQEALGLTNDGQLGPKTRKAIEGRYGPLGALKHTKQPMPFLVSRWGYDHAHDIDAPTWPYPDPEWEKVTSGGSWEEGMLRLVSGYSPKSGKTSRPGRSVISLDLTSLSFPHWPSGGNLGEVVSLVANKFPELAEFAWGEMAEAAKDERRVNKIIPRGRGKMKHSAEYGWLWSGWWAIGSHPDVVAFLTDYWLEDYLGKAKRAVSKMGWSKHLHGPNGGQILAAFVRMSNSGAGLIPTWFKNTKHKAKSRGVLDRIDACFRVDREKATDPKTGKRRHVGGYGHHDRWVKITSWSEFENPVPEKWL